MQECNLPRNSWLRLIETVRGRGAEEFAAPLLAYLLELHRTIDRPCLKKLIFHAAAKRHPCYFAS